MKKSLAPMLGLLGLVSIAVLAVLAWWLLWRQIPLPEGLVQANGRIEGDHYTVATKVPGRVVELFAREGDEIALGQILLRLDDKQLRAKVEQARQGLAAIKPQLAATQRTEEQRRRDALRLRNLLAQGTATKHESEQAALAWAVSREQLTTLQAQQAQAQAILAEAQSVLDDLVVRAPAAGHLTTRMANVGEVISPGAPLFDIVDLDRLYLQVYVPEKDIGKVRLGLAARIHTDAFPNEPLDATVRYIAAQAEFTPKEVQTPDERVKLVYAVKLYLDGNPEHRAMPGLPADAMIRWKDEVPWVSPQW
ncbi:HlyD family secretion protein [Ferribacterium limneticum]|uniref:HlyD family secretion protein n=1 Tax=Ferribacterium limneticum TaxID=76259 RepID=UPI001CF81E10|nr:efflux RND transporter periplasmic adaptor subunit [Ferribacterium limneticum]UCV23632.1 efflux RND transporter periplasmic adaptor subunit [Ferribacterium limneticum]